MNEETGAVTGTLWETPASEFLTEDAELVVEATCEGGAEFATLKTTSHHGTDLRYTLNLEQLSTLIDNLQTAEREIIDQSRQELRSGGDGA